MGGDTSLPFQGDQGLSLPADPLPFPGHTRSTTRFAGLVYIERRERGERERGGKGGREERGEKEKCSYVCSSLNPGDLGAPLHSTDPFFHLVVLFSSLIRHNVFSYSLYLSLLIAKGEVKSPIIPLLPFARDGESLYHHPRPEPESELSLSISLPVLKKPRLEHGGGGEGGGGVQETPSGLVSPSNMSGFR